MSYFFKNRSRSFFARLFLSFFLLAPVHQSAQAQVSDESWVKICGENPQENKSVCLVTQELRSESGQFLASVALREISDEARRTLLFAVPPGMLIQPGLRVQIDTSEPKDIKYGICFPNACYAELVIDDAFIASLKKGSRLVLTALNQNAKALNFDLTLVGFTKAYDGPPLDEEEVKARKQALQKELQKKAEEARRRLIQEQERTLQNGQ